jgi:putative radical SAM enzyme (TIGR03279 family)
MGAKYAHITAKIIKDTDEPLGIDFEDELLGKSSFCKNHCIFCFVDQLPKGMRKTLYHKDEDWRYSLIYGNYVTLANLSDAEFKRILKREISNLYISVHAVDENIRKLLLGNDNAKDIKKILRKFAQHKIMMQTQIVLCKGINDENVLEESVKFLSGLYPYVQSISVIPVGMTQFRDRLYDISDFSGADARKVVKTVEKWQSAFRKKRGVGLVYASDEMYIKAGLKVPEFDSYDGFPQIENGVGMIAKFEREFNDALSGLIDAKPMYNKVSMVTGEAFYEYLEKYCNKVCKTYDIDINCYAVSNSFFKGKIDVAGLLTSADIQRTLSGVDIGDVAMISATMLKENEPVFLDDVSITQLSKTLGCEIKAVPNDGYAFINSLFEE